MDTTMDRRRLLSTAVLGGASVVGATALGSLAPEAAFAAEPVEVEPGTPDPNFAEGRITAMSVSQPGFRWWMGVDKMAVDAQPQVGEGDQLLLVRTTTPGSIGHDTVTAGGGDHETAEVCSTSAV